MNISDSNSTRLLGRSAQWATRLAAMRAIPVVLRLVWKLAPQTFVAGILLRLVTAGMPLAMAYVARLIVDRVVGLIQHTHDDQFGLWLLVGVEGALALLGVVLGRLIDYCDGVFADRYMAGVSVEVMRHATTLDLEAYENPTFYDCLERARVQATDRLAMIQSIGRLLQQAVTTISLSTAIILFAPWLFVITGLCVLPAVFVESHFAVLEYAKNLRQTPAKRQLDYLRVTGASKEGAKEMKLFGLGPFFAQRFAGIAQGISQENRQFLRRRLFGSVFLSWVSTAGYYGAYVYVVERTIHGQFSLGTLTFLAASLTGAASGLSQTFSTLSSVADQSLYIADLAAFLEMRPSLKQAASPIRVPRPIRQGFEFRNVSFRYPGTERLVLDDVSFRISPGERVALIGENGQGKTTIVKLITRLYDPQEGQILLDGIDLREYDLEDLQREIAVVFQDFVRYEMTARENIGVGRVSRMEATDLIEAAAEKSQAAEVIDRLPQGFEQMLGRRFDGGVDLSGGEWQRLALARAYLRDAQVLILDEPTASLDAKAEAEVYRRFAELTANKMALLISHRFSTVRMADRIIVLADGRVAEQGNHQQLVAKAGLYAELFELQANSYR